VLRPYGVMEMVRTGIVAMRRGSKSSGALTTTVVASAEASGENVSYSV
jgi:hypothetical protein